MRPRSGATSQPLLGSGAISSLPSGFKVLPKAEGIFRLTPHCHRQEARLILNDVFVLESSAVILSDETKNPCSKVASEYEDCGQGGYG